MLVDSYVNLGLGSSPEDILRRSLLFIVTPILVTEKDRKANLKSLLEPQGYTILGRGLTHPNFKTLSERGSTKRLPVAKFHSSCYSIL